MGRVDLAQETEISPVPHEKNSAFQFDIAMDPIARLADSGSFRQAAAFEQKQQIRVCTASNVGCSNVDANKLCSIALRPLRHLSQRIHSMSSPVTPEDAVAGPLPACLQRA